MEKSIQAVVINGFHKGHIVRVPYAPTLNLPKPITIMVDTCCGGDEMLPEPAKILTYKECFRAVDRGIVLYSVEGKSQALFEDNGFFGFTPEFTSKPWTPKTVLYFGYHDGFLRRKELD